MKSILVTAALAASSLLAFAPAAHAVPDALICYSTIFSQTAGGNPSGTVNFPQLTNSTKYVCSSATQYTLSQLAQGGWIVVQLDEALYSNTYNSDGSVTTASRYRLVLRR